MNSSRINFHKDVAEARAEYNALRKFSNISLPTGTEQLLLDAEQLVVQDKAAAKEVENSIAALSPKTSTAQDVQAVKTAFEALTPVQQQLVPNVWTLVDYVNGKYKLPTKGNTIKRLFYQTQQPYQVKTRRCPKAKIPIKRRSMLLTLKSSQSALF